MVYSDSQLVVRQIEDTYQAKSETMLLYLQKVRDLLKKFVLVQIKHIPRAENSRADALEKLATALQEDLGRSTSVEYLAEPSIDPYSMVVALVRSVLSWMDPIGDYINDGTLPDDPKEATKIRVRSSRFTNHKGSLYKRGFVTPFLKCIAGEDTEYVLREVHEGICGNHIGDRTFAGKVLRQGYYWPTILKDATGLVKKCRICQEHAKISPPVRAPNINYQPLALPAVGVGHNGTSAHWQGPMQIHNRRSRLLLQVGRGRALSHNYRTEDTQLCVASYHMQVWYSKSLGIRQRETIRQCQIKRFLRRARN